MVSINPRRPPANAFRFQGGGQRGLGLGSNIRARDILIAILSFLAIYNLIRNRPNLDFSTTTTSASTTTSNANTPISSSASSAIPQRNQSNTYNHSLYKSNDVLQFDLSSLANIKATFSGARSHLEWSPKSLSNVEPVDDINSQFQAMPLLATVDRRPLMVRKQLLDDEAGGKLANNGKLMGCAISATTFVSNLESQYLKHYKEYTPTCDVCFQFSNREDMNDFVPSVGYEPLKPGQESIATKCFGGKAALSARFADWQQNDARFKGYGYPWTIECVLPNGIQELTCREISRLQASMDESSRDDVQDIYFKTRFALDGWFGIWSKQVLVHSRWPWKALMSHDDDRSRIAEELPNAWNDVKSAFIPKSAKELKLVHVEGPGYDKTEYDGSLSLKSMKKNDSSMGGVHFRLVSNLFHLIRNAPGSTHMIAVVDGQAKRTYSRMVTLLNSKISDLYPTYGKVISDSIPQLHSAGTDLIPIGSMANKSSNYVRWTSDVTLMEVLRQREIKIHIVPIVTPSMAFEKNVCGGQYTFTAYLAARFAADYQVMMYIDGDTAMVEHGKNDSSSTLQSILYDRFFSNKSSKCAGHRLRLIEQYVKPADESVERVLQCTHDLSSDAKKWKYAMENCHLKEGHIVARTDSIYALSVHHPDTLPGYLPKGVEDCITKGNKETDRYFLKASEFVQLHLRNRERKPECACFANAI